MRNNRKVKFIRIIEVPKALEQILKLKEIIKSQKNFKNLFINIYFNN